MRAALSSAIIRLAAALALSAMAVGVGLAAPAADQPIVSLQPELRVAEGVGTARLAIRSSAAFAEPLVISVRTAGGTATPGADYGPVSALLTLPAGERELLFGVPIFQDDLHEDAERILVSMALLPGAPAAAGRDSTSILIRDDDPMPRVSLSLPAAGSASVGEGAGQIELVLSLDRPAGRPIRLLVQTAEPATGGEPATPGADYGPLRLWVSFAPGVTERRISLPIRADSLVEPPELVEVVVVEADGATPGVTKLTLTILDETPTPVPPASPTPAPPASPTPRPPAPTPPLRPPPASPTVTPEPPTLAFVAARPLAISEDNPGSPAKDFYITVQLSRAAGQPISVAVRPAGSATLGADYSLLDTTLLFPPGSLRQRVMVRVRADRLVEAEETIELRLEQASYGLLGGAPATIRIADNDRPRLGLTVRGLSRAGEGYQNPGGFKLWATLAEAAGRPVGARLSLGGSATRGQDYSLATLDLSFAPGELRQEVFVRLIDDQLVEAAETITVSIAGAGGGDPSAPLTLTIEDDDRPRVSLTASSYIQIAEGAWGDAGTVDLAVSLGAPAGRPVLVRLEAGGTATRDGDYLLSADELRFAPGETLKAVSLRVLDDGEPEGDEQLTIALFDAESGARLAEVIVVIRDDDLGE